MMFCPKCSAMVIPKKEGILCKCGYSSKKVAKMQIKEEKKKEEEISIVDSDKEALPITDEECGKCKNKKAYYWLVQTRAGDEPETKFLKCTKCKHTWRDYS